MVGRMRVEAYGVFPAHAGMSRTAGHCRLRHSGFPRTRGDEPVTMDLIKDLERFSPHTRG